MTAEAITFGRGKAPRVLAKSFTPRLRVQTPKRLQLLVSTLGRGNNCIISYPQLWPEEGHAPTEATFLHGFRFEPRNFGYTRRDCA